MICTGFSVSPGLSNSGSLHWTVQIAVSNAGPRRVELRSASLVGRYRTGETEWVVPVPNSVITSENGLNFNADIAFTNPPADGPMVWSLKGYFRTRDTPFLEWFGRMQSILPADIFHLPRPTTGTFDLVFPANHDAILTNELGWRPKLFYNGRYAFSLLVPGEAGDDFVPIGVPVLRLMIPPQ